MNPRAAINDLLPFQGSPFGQLGYFSIKNGEGGIRTHAPFRTNGFQDRLVMTTSIPLHLFTCLPLPYHLSDKMYSITAFHCRQHLFQTFFIFLYFSYFPVFFVYKYSSLQRLIHRLRSAFYMLNKSFCRIQIFRCRNLNITVRAFI